MMANALDEAERLLAAGDDLASAGKHAEALGRFQAAWSALPEPREQQDPAIRVLGAIADCHFLLGQWEECRRAVQHASRCVADLDNPFLRLRLGQSLYELGDEREAANWLVPAYLSEGRALFEHDDPKYLEFFRSQLEAPPGGWPEGW
jgi:tetratricopeptide (TPR) repeat protein